MSATAQLLELIRDLRKQEPSPHLAQRARIFLQTVAPEELAQVKRELTKAGLNPEDLRHVCAIGGLPGQDRTRELLAALPAGHVLHTLIGEHSLILDFLDRLTALNTSVQELSSLTESSPLLASLRQVVRCLIDTESHHKREEDVLFPSLSAMGLTGPPMVMESEHHQMRTMKGELNHLVSRPGAMRAAAFKARLNELAGSLCRTLSEHIFKENNILYPAALRLIQGEDAWNDMKRECDHIGYCSFTPGPEGTKA